MHKRFFTSPSLFKDLDEARSFCGGFLGCPEGRSSPDWMICSIVSSLASFISITIHR